MPQNLAEIVNPLVENGLFEDAESAVRELMTDYVSRQIEGNRARIKHFEKKYGMAYQQFNHYLAERAKNMATNQTTGKKFMLEEEDALDWKIATEMLQSWLGLKGKKS